MEMNEAGPDIFYLAHTRQFQPEPFLEKSLIDVFQPLLKMVVKAEVLKEAHTSLTLVNHDLSKFSNVIQCELIKLPTATKALLSSTSFTNDPNK